MESVEVYLDIEGWAYDGIYTRLDNLPGLNENEKCWTMLGAVIYELLNSRYYSAKIYHDSRVVDEWHEDVKFMSRRSKKIASKIKNKFADRFLSLEIEKLDSRTISKEKDEIRKNMG